jgi:hypothetical protein
MTSRQQTQRTVLDWPRLDYAIEKPRNKLLAATDRDSDTWAAEVKRITHHTSRITFHVSRFTFLP